MKLIIVERAKIATFRRLKEMFADDLNVEVVFDRRFRDRRRKIASDIPRSMANIQGSERRRTNDRRRLSKSAHGGRDYVVIQLAR